MVCGACLVPQAFFEDLASRTYVQDIHLVTQTGPTPAGLLHELAQKKLVPLFTIEYDGAGAGMEPPRDGQSAGVPALSCMPYSASRLLVCVCQARRGRLGW